MRNRIRIQPWIPLEVRRRARAYCLTHRMTESALTAAALIQYMDDTGVDEDLVVRRLDGLTRAVAQVQHDQDVLGVAFKGYVWRSIRSAEAPTPEGFQRATSAYLHYLSQTNDQVRNGVRLSQHVLRAGSNQPPGPDAAKDGDGGKGGGGK